MSFMALLPQPLPTVTELMRAHGFTKDDLALNRAGRLSTRQRRALSLRALRQMALGIALIGVAALLHQTTNSLAARVLCGLGALGLWAVAAQLIVATRAPRPVTALAGPLFIEGGRVYHPVSYRVAGRSLTLTGSMRRRDSYRSIIPGRLYRGYLLTRVDLLVSLEPIEREEQ